MLVPGSSRSSLDGTAAQAAVQQVSSATAAWCLWPFIINSMRFVGSLQVLLLHFASAASAWHDVGDLFPGALAATAAAVVGAISFKA
jgi:hypothetical protein